MKKQLLLRHTADFTRMRQEGAVFRHPFLILNVASNDLPHNRYGFITSKRLGNAVKRNRIRRLLRESIRILHPTLASGFDVVIVGRSAIVGQPLPAVKSALADRFQQAGMRKDSA